MKNWIYILLLSFIPFTTARAQSNYVKGIVIDSINRAPIKGAIVTIRNYKNYIIYSTQTTTDGKFTINIDSKKTDNCNMFINRIGYEKAICPLTSKDFYCIEISPKTYSIKEVYVRPEKIRHRNDTTSFLVSSFTTVKDRTIGDVLRNMPGIDISSTGTISYNGKAIDEFMIEGLDLFDGQYNIATKNISHKIISKVDIIENHQPSKALKNSKEKTGTILNLGLKDKAKGQWSGNVRAALGLPKLWEAELFDAKLSASSQMSLVAKTNNSGKDIISENKTLTLEEYLRRKNNKGISQILDISQNTPGFIDNERTNNARTHIANIANIKKINENTTLRYKMYYSDYRNSAEYYKGTSYYTKDSIIAYSTSEQSIVKSRELNASLLLKSDSEHNFFSEEIKYSSVWNNNHAYIKGDYNNNSDTYSNAHSIENNIEWIKPIGKHYIKLYSRNKYTIIPEKMKVHDLAYRLQDMTRKQFVSSTNINYTQNIKRWAIAMDAEENISISDFNSHYYEELNDSNSTSYLRSNAITLALKAELVYKYKGVRVEFQMPVNICHFWGTRKINNILYQPHFSCKWQINSQWNVRASLSAGTTEPELYNNYNSPIMTDYQTYRTNPVIFSKNKSNSATFGIKYVDYTSMLFANASIMHTKNNNRTSIYKEISNDRIYYSTTEGNNKTESSAIFGSISKYLNSIKGNISLKSNYTENNATICQNNTYIDYKSYSWQNTLDITSNPLNWLDMNYQLSYNINSLKMLNILSSNQLLKQNMQITILPTDDIHLSVTAEHYVNKFKGKTTKQIFFGDIKCLYRFKKTDFSLNITNIFNQKSYYNTEFTDISSSYSSYSLRGRNILFGITTYF
jgi:hypothetical protein